MVQTADQGAHTPMALYLITFWVSMYPERKQFWTKKKKHRNCDSALRFHQKTIFTFLNSALRRSDNMEKCEPSHRRLLTWVRLTPSVWHTWKADHAYVPTQHATKKSHILGKHRSSSERSGSIQALFSPTSPFPIFWEFRSFTSTQRAASAAAGGGETPLQFKVG